MIREGYVWRIDFQRKDEKHQQTRSVMVVARDFERAGGLFRETIPDATILSIYTMGVRDVICEDNGQ